MDSVKLDNPKLNSVFGGQLKTRSTDEQGKEVTTQLDLKAVIEYMLRATESDGRSLTVTGMEDSSRVQTIGKSLQQSINGSIEFAEGDYKWLCGKAKTNLWRIFPTEAANIYEILSNKLS